MAYDRGRSMYYIEIKRITDESANDVAEAVLAPPTKASTEIKMPREMDINVANGLCHLREKLIWNTRCHTFLK